MKFITALGRIQEIDGAIISKLGDPKTGISIEDKVNYFEILNNL